MKVLAFWVCGLIGISPALGQNLDRDLESAGVAGRVVSSCEFPAFSHGGWYAIAFESPDGGQYGVLHPTGRIQILADWSGSPELSCHDSHSAEALNLTVSKSDTIEGGLEVEPEGAVVCVFVDSTESKCWQYSEQFDSFVAVGGWIT